MIFAKRIGLLKSHQARLDGWKTAGHNLGYRACLDPIRLGLDQCPHLSRSVLEDTREMSPARGLQRGPCLPSVALEIRQGI